MQFRAWNLRVLGKDLGEVGVEFGVGLEDGFAFAVAICEGLLAVFLDDAVPTQQGLPGDDWMECCNPVWNALGVKIEAEIYCGSVEGKVGAGLELLEALQDCDFGV